jgi:hypothetical protein
LEGCFFIVIGSKNKFGNFVWIFECKKVRFPIGGMVHISPEREEGNNGDGCDGDRFNKFAIHYNGREVQK